MSQEGSSADKKPESADRGPIHVALITTGGTIVVALIGAGALFLAHGGGSGTSPSPTPTVSSAVVTTPTQHAAPPTSSSVSPSGTITSPLGDGSNVAARKNLHLSGTAQDIPSGYRIDLFLNWVNVNNYYIAADPKIAITLHNGHWAAPIYVGDPGSIIIRLVLLSPSEIAYVDSPSSVPYQNNGFPALPGTTLASATYTAH